MGSEGNGKKKLYEALCPSLRCPGFFRSLFGILVVFLVGLFSFGLLPLEFFRCALIRASLCTGLNKHETSSVT